MSVIELILLGVALSADAFAVSLTHGVKMPYFLVRSALIYAFTFGFFQALMPLLGYLLGSTVAAYVDKWSPYIAFLILSIIGIKMIVDSIKNKDSDVDCIKNCEICANKNTCQIIKIDYKKLLLLAISTSIDAFAVGVTFSFLGVNLFLSVIVIGLITFALCFLGVFIGFKFGARFRKISEIIGGAVLVLIGIRMIVSALFF